MKNILTFAGTATDPPDKLTITNQNGYSIGGIRVDNPSLKWYYLRTANAYIPPLTLGWSYSYLHGIASEFIFISTPSGYSSPTGLLPQTPIQIQVEVTDDPQEFGYGAPFGADLGPRLGSVNQPIREIWIQQAQGPVGIVVPIVVDISGGGTTPGAVDLRFVGGSAIAIGQAAMAASLPVVIASNQSAVGVDISQGTPLKSATGTTSQVASNAASVTILAANANRKGFSIQNDDANPLFLRFANGGAASATVYSARLIQFGYYDDKDGGAVYTGAVTGIWSAAGAGAARVTEYT